MSFVYMCYIHPYLETLIRNNFYISLKIIYSLHVNTHNSFIKNNCISKTKKISENFLNLFNIWIEDSWILISVYAFDLSHYEE